MLCVTIFVILAVWFLLPRVAMLMIHTPAAISIFVCLSMVHLIAVYISMPCSVCAHFVQAASTLTLVADYAIAARSCTHGGSASISRRTAVCAPPSARLWVMTHGATWETGPVRIVVRQQSLTAALRLRNKNVSDRIRVRPAGGGSSTLDRPSRS